MSDIEAYGRAIGENFIVNTTTTKRQASPQVASLADGSFVVVWYDGSGAAAPGPDIRGQRYDADGNKAGDEFIVNVDLAATATYAAVAATPNGGFIVSWTSVETGVHARTFAADGRPTSGDLTIDGDVSAAPISPSIAVLADGSYMVAWQIVRGGTGTTARTDDAVARIFDANNVPITTSFTIGSSANGIQRTPRVIATASNEFVVAWTDDRPVAGEARGFEIMSRRFGATGVALDGEMVVNLVTTGAQTSPAVASLDGGGYAVAWRDVSAGSPGAIKLRLYDAAGRAQGSEVNVSADFVSGYASVTSPTIVADRGGGFVVGWSVTGSTPDLRSNAIVGQQFDRAGEPVGDPVVFSQNDIGGLDVTAATSTSGRVLAVWSDFGIDNGRMGDGRIVGQLFEVFPRVVGSAAADTLTGTAAGEIIEGLGGDDTLYGLAGADQLDGGAGNDLIDGGGGNDKLHGGTGEDVLIGGGGDDTLYGGDGNDRLTASVGAAWLVGGGGDDVLTLTDGRSGARADGGDGDDRIEVSGTEAFATVFVSGGGGNDVIRVARFTSGIVDGGDGDDTIELDADGITVILGRGADRLVPIAGPGRLEVRDFRAGEAGDRIDLSVFGSNPLAAGGRLTMMDAQSSVRITDTVTGGIYVLQGVRAGDLSAYNLGVPAPLYAPVGATLSDLFGTSPQIKWGSELIGADGDDVIHGFGGNDTLLGGGGNDRLEGGPDDDLLGGGTGNDTLDGGTGIDLLIGGMGDDVYVIDDASDVVTELAGEGIDTIFSKVGYVLAAGASIETLSSENHASTDRIDLTGNALAQTIVGNYGANRLTGGGGADTLIGLRGDDTYIVSHTDTVIRDYAVDGNDVAIISALNYQLAGDAEIEMLAAEAGAAPINIAGNGFSQILRGNDGANILSTGGGAPDTMIGGLGDDIYRVFSTGDVIDDAGGYDIVYASGTSYFLYSTASVEFLSPSEQAGTQGFYLVGNGAAQVIAGNYGDNTLNGRGGDGFALPDTLIGLYGDDTYAVFSQGDVVREVVSQGRDAIFASASYQLRTGTEIELLSAVDQSAGDSASAYILRGNEFGQIVAGNNAGNVLDGRGGNDTLVGLGGADTFAFTTALDATGNVDTVRDFASGSDKIGLASDVFAGVTDGGITAGEFVVGTAAADADDRLVYDQATGRLFYDADGNGAGAAVLFAQFAASTVLAASDFVVVAPVASLPAA